MNTEKRKGGHSRGKDREVIFHFYEENGSVSKFGVQFESKKRSEDHVPQFLCHQLTFVISFNEKFLLTGRYRRSTDFRLGGSARVAI